MTKRLDGSPPALAVATTIESASPSGTATRACAHQRWNRANGSGSAPATSKVSDGSGAGTSSRTTCTLPGERMRIEGHGGRERVDVERGGRSVRLDQSGDLVREQVVGRAARLGGERRRRPPEHALRRSGATGDASISAIHPAAAAPRRPGARTALADPRAGAAPPPLG